MPGRETGCSWPLAAGSAPWWRRSVLVLKREVGAADGSGQLRPLPRELESRGELRGDFHPFGQLEPDRPLLGVVDGVHHIDRQAALVEDVGYSDIPGLEGRSLERARRDDDVTFFPEDPVYPVDGCLVVSGRLHREDVVILVLEVAGLIRSQTSERRRGRRRLQADGRNGGEIHGIGHDALPNAYGGLRRPEEEPWEGIAPAGCQMQSRRWVGT